MNGLSSSLREVDRIVQDLAAAPAGAEVAICPPATLLAALSVRLAGTGVLTGGQDCHPEAAGARTGDISAEMLKDAGARFVIVGHSERRADHAENDALVQRKSDAAIRAHLTPIVCVGETEAERRAGEAEKIVGRQLAGSLPARGEFVVAYEPVWAIGTGLTPSEDDIAAMHAFIRNRIGPARRILYGGSVKPANAARILALCDVNGALVGGASLKAEEFLAIIRAA